MNPDFSVNLNNHIIQFNEVLTKRSFAIGFRPIADLACDEILGHILTIRGPLGIFGGAFWTMARVAILSGQALEFTCSIFESALDGAIDSAAEGLLFMAIPDGVIEVAGMPLADALRNIVLSRPVISNRLIIIVPEINQEIFPQCAEWIACLNSAGIVLASLNCSNDHSQQQCWSEITPQYSLLEKKIFEGHDLSALKRPGLGDMIGYKSDHRSKLIADGINTPDELLGLKVLGIQYGAGDFIGRSSSVPVQMLSGKRRTFGIKPEAQYQGSSPGVSVLKRLILNTEPVRPATTSDEAFSIFEHDPVLRAVAVVSEGIPIGLISRYDMVDNLARPYRHELFGRKPCTLFMDADPLILEIDISLKDLTDIVIGTDPRHLISGFIITERGIYSGIGSVQDLMREVTAMQLEAAKYANPLTQLPGSVPINQYIDNTLQIQAWCCVAYCDLDHFKPFNDVYGYAKGDEVIQLCGRILAEVCDQEMDFIGHIGGDDFVIIFRSSNWFEKCQTALHRFEVDIQSFFNASDIERGGYFTENRQGNISFHNLTSLSIGALEVEPGVFQNHLQISKVAAEVKRRAKAIGGNSIYVNKRGY